jgi:alkylmercury lyase
MTRPEVTILERSWDAILPRFSPTEQEAGRTLLRELARGEPVSAARLAEALGTPVGEAEVLLRSSALSPFVYMDADGRVVGFWGLSTVAMHHRFTVNDRTLWTWCAEDSLFLPELIDAPADVESRDPESGVSVRLRVVPDGIASVDPEGVCVSILRPDTAELSSAARVVATICHFIFFFASRESGERWVSKHPETVLLSIDEAFAFGKRLNTHLFGVVLQRQLAERPRPVS